MKQLTFTVLIITVMSRLSYAQNIFQPSGNAGVGTTLPIQQFNLNQVAGTAKGLLISGDEYYMTGNGSSNGMLMLLGVNRPGNRQMWFGDNTNLGSSTAGFLRFLIYSGSMPSLNCISGDGVNYLPFNLGDNVSNIGVGFSTNSQLPASKITINGNLAVGNGYLANAAPANGAMIQGNVLIGRTTQQNSAYMLDVAGPAHATSIVVNSGGADFVFEPAYHLNSLAWLSKYINQNHHLPEIPSAKQMQAEGLNVGENQVKLLQKVEELTLYLIEKDKEIRKQSQQLKAQQKQIDLLINKSYKHKNKIK
jgi:hypothetical protein